MGTEIFRTKIIQLYHEMREPDQHFATMFEVREGNISDTEFVRLDIVREDEEVSPVVNLFEGPTWNTFNQWVTKEWNPPTIQEAMPYTAAQGLKREPGTDHFRAVEVKFQEQMMRELLLGMARMDKKIRRNIEWQSSQILQTGLLDLTDEDGNVTYSIDFQPKAAHFPSAATAWDVGGANPLEDITGVANSIRDNSLHQADQLTFGELAWDEFLRNPFVVAHLDNRRMELGGIAPEGRGNGAVFQGTIWIGSYRYELWTYTGRGILPGASVKTKFLDDIKVVVRAKDGRLDRVFAGVPSPVKVDPRFADFLPERLSVPMAVDISPNIYADASGRNTTLDLTSRPLCIPTAIDTFGTIDTGITP